MSTRFPSFLQKLGFQQRELELEDAFQERLRIREAELDELHRQDLVHMKAKWDAIQIEALEFQENTLSAALKRQIRVVRCPVWFTWFASQFSDMAISRTSLFTPQAEPRGARAEVGRGFRRLPQEARDGTRGQVQGVGETGLFSGLSIIHHS